MDDLRASDVVLLQNMTIGLLTRGDTVPTVNAIPDDENRWAHLFLPRTPEALMAGLVLLSFTVLAAFMPAQNDTWWHLATGRRIAEVTGRVELVDHFSWTAAGHYWPNSQWLSQLLFFVTYSVGGMATLALTGMLLVTSTLVLVWRIDGWATPAPRRCCCSASGRCWSASGRCGQNCSHCARWRSPCCFCSAGDTVGCRRCSPCGPTFTGASRSGLSRWSPRACESLVHDRARLPRLALASAASGWR